MSTALVVIDVQESFRQHPTWEHISAPDITDRITRLVDHARASGDTIAWVLHSSPGTGTTFDPDNGLVTLMPGLEPADGDLHVTKTSHNAFTTTNLAQQLQARAITHLRICGIRTEQCVETTTRLASDLGYTVELVLDATATHPLPLADGSGTLSAQTVIERTAAALAGRFASITTIDDIVEGGTP